MKKKRQFLKKLKKRLFKKIKKKKKALILENRRLGLAWRLFNRRGMREERSTANKIPDCFAHY